MTMSMRERRKRALMMYNALSGIADYPAVVAGLGYNVWDWAADDISTLFQDSAGSTPLTTTIVDGVPVPNDNQPIGRWVDRIQAVPATQGTTAAKPTFRTATLNGKPTLAFDGGDLLATANISISTFALWVVTRRTGGSIILYEQGASISGNDGMLYVFSPAADSIYVRRGGVTSSKDATVIATDSVWRTIRHEYNGTHASHLVYYNNVNAVTGDGTVADPGTGTTSAALNIGARSTLANAITGNIAQLIIVSPYPTASIITNMESWVNTKWGGVY